MARFWGGDEWFFWFWTRPPILVSWGEKACMVVDGRAVHGWGGDVGGC